MTLREVPPALPTQTLSSSRWTVLATRLGFPADAIPPWRLVLTARLRGCPWCLLDSSREVTRGPDCKGGHKDSWGRASVKSSESTRHRGSI